MILSKLGRSLSRSSRAKIGVVIMKTERLFLDELTPNSRGYKVKVKVIEKNRAKESPTKKVTYQNLMLQDEKGHKMKAALFGEQIEGYNDVIAYNGEYEIANAIIKPVDERWKGDPTALDYQMSFGKYTVIQPTDDALDYNTPQYSKLSLIPKFADATERFDVLVVVLFVEAAPGKQVTFANRTSKVRELMVIDESVPQPILVSAWHDLADADCDLLHENTTYLPIVGITALRTSNHKGFSLTTTMSTTIIHDPKFEQAQQLQTWVSQNRLSLTKLRLKILAVKSDDSVQEVSPIAALRAKKANDVFQDEKHNLEVRLSEPDFDKINAYVGCSICGKTTSTPIGKSFGCEVCRKAQCIAAPKITFKCDVMDGTGNLPLTLFTESCETLFGMSAADVFHMRHSEDLAAFEAVKKKLETRPVIIRVGPSTSLTKNRVLQWVFQNVVEAELKKDDAAKAENEVEAKNTDASSSEDDVQEVTQTKAKQTRPSEKVTDTKAKQDKPSQKISAAKRRLILSPDSSASEDNAAEPAIVEHMLDTLSTFSNSNEEVFSPSPDESPATPLDK